MSIRTYDEVCTAIDRAHEASDLQALESCTEELLLFNTPTAARHRLNTLGWIELTRGKPVLAQQHFEQSLQLSTEMDDAKLVADANTNVGIAYYYQGNFASAVVYWNAALVEYEAIHDREGTANIVCNLGNAMQAIGNYPQALEQYSKALALHSEVGATYFMGNDTMNMGNIYCTTGNYPSALEYFHRALALYEEVGSVPEAALLLHDLGIVYFDMSDFTLALEYYTRALERHEEIGATGEIASVHGSLGSMHMTLGDFPLALEHSKRALQQHLEDGRLDSVAHTTCLMAHIYASMGSFEEMELLIAKLDTMHIVDPLVLISLDTARAKLLSHQGFHDRAEESLYTALAIARKHTLPKSEATINQLLRDFAFTQNNLAKYVEYNNEYTRISEEINGKDTATRLAMQEADRRIAHERLEHAKHLAVLHSTLPKHIADRVARGEVVNDHYDNAAVLFLDIVGFTTMSSTMEAGDVVQLLDRLFAICDSVMNTHGMMKIKTIGDSYMAVAFENINNAALAALDLVQAITDVPVRIGIHCGPVVAGVLGKERMQYDVWGDTVNVASRMESSSEAGRVHVSEAFVINLKSNTVYRIQNSMIESENTESLLTSHSSLDSSLLTSHFNSGVLLTSRVKAS